MCANDLYASERKNSVSSESVFGSSCDSVSSPPSSRSLSPDFLFSHQAQRKFYDDWDLGTSDSIVNQILSNVVCLDEDDKDSKLGSDFNDLTLNYINLATQNLLI
jgi:hypothetical protein